MDLKEPLDKIDPELQPQKSRVSIGFVIELLLGTFFIIMILIRDVLGFPRSYELGLLSACVLGVIYLFANWWLNKPSQTSARTILITILFGLTSFVLIFAIVFRLLYLPGEYEMRLLSLGLVVITSILDAATSVNKVKVSNPRTKWRFTILAGIIVLYMYIPQDKRIRFSYRNYPEFIQYYDQQKASMEFHEIEEAFFGE